LTVTTYDAIKHLREIGAYPHDGGNVAGMQRCVMAVTTTIANPRLIQRAGLCQIDLGYKDSATLSLKGIISPLLTGNAGPFSYYSGIDVWTDYRNDTIYRISPYQPFKGPPYNLYGRVDSGQVRASDVIRGGISWQGSWIGANINEISVGSW